jgi:hypothetical protein
LVVVAVAIPGIIDLTVATSRVVVFRRWATRLVICPRRVPIGSVCTIVVLIADRGTTNGGGGGGGVGEAQHLGIDVERPLETDRPKIVSSEALR